MAQDIRTEVIIAGNLSYLNNIIEIERIEHLSRTDLRILKSTILAKYGYEFTSNDLREHFSVFPWYNGTKSAVYNELSSTDLINAATIQSLENSNETRLHNGGSFGRQLIISERIYTFKDNSEEPGEVNIGGQVIASVNGIEIARANIIGNEFFLSLDEVPQDMLRHWAWSYDDVVQCSDPETRLAYLELRITGTELDIRRASYFDGNIPSLRQYFMEEKRPGMRVNDNYYYEDYFSYIYSDRDTFLRGVDHHEDFGQGKIIYNVALKRGWNKVKYYRAEMNGFTQYNVHISEASLEKGSFSIFYFDFDDYLNDEFIQFATLEGEIIAEKNSNLEDRYYFLLTEPIRVQNSFDEVREVHKLLLLANFETIPSWGNYVLFGEILHFLSQEGDVIFYVIEVKEGGMKWQGPQF
jgi:hypothetical protein